MTLSAEDLQRATQARSDQVNSSDLLSGPLTSRIIDVRAGNADQPVIIDIDSHPQPWKPSKTALRVLCACWGGDPSQWIGKTAVLYNDEKVKWGGVEVGGIRVSHLSDITSTKKISVNATRGKKEVLTVDPLRIQSAPQQPVEPTYYPEEKFEANFEAWANLIRDGKKTHDQIITNVERGGKLTQGQRGRIMGVTIAEPEKKPEPETPLAESDDPFGDD